MLTTNQYKKVAIGDCCEIISGSTPSRNKVEYWDGEINWFTPKDLSRIKSKYISEAPEKITALGLKSCSTTPLPKNSLLLSSRAPIGHIAITTIEACTNQGFKSLIPNKNLDVEYLYYAIKNIIPQLKDLGNGATFKEISKSTLSKVQIPMPPLAEQKQIAAILDAADKLRQKDQQLVEHYTSLSQSLFLDMFGDPFDGDTYPLADHIFILGGYAFKSEDYIKEEGIPLIKISTVNRGYFDDTNFSFLPESFTSKYEKWIIKKNDILMSLTGTVGKDDYGNVAMASDTYEKYFLNQRVAKISSINNSYHPEFLFGMFSNARTKQELTKLSRGVRQANISNRDIYGLKMIKPTLHAQNKYIVAIKTIEQQQKQAQKNLEKSEILFNSLLQRAFTGELTANKAA
ncbi:MULTISPECIES: restriction endonuclease subunit S [Methylophaga]|uniref:restriction endonuclease subunit S n=1 Tax=Methylophaga TaxID=40222 RepID=UPI00175D9F15|nr:MULTISPECIES: restriction endonuclease subunit S [Methylophaga]HIC47014.1 restriction endonuclease subunit S [Methylophaga sp.]